MHQLVDVIFSGDLSKQSDFKGGRMSLCGGESTQKQKMTKPNKIETGSSMQNFSFELERVGIAGNEVEKEFVCRRVRVVLLTG